MNPTVPPAKDVLAALQLDPQSVKSIKSRWQRSLYQAVLNWLTRYHPDPNSSNFEQVRGLLESFHNLCELEAWEQASRLLRIQLNTPMKSWMINSTPGDTTPNRFSSIKNYWANWIGSGKLK